MFFRILTVAIAASLFTNAAIALASSRDPNAPQPDSSGEFYSAKRANGGYHQLWLVKADSVNCRTGPQLSNPAARGFTRGEVLEADSDTPNGSDIEPIVTDSQGKPWLRVRIGGGVCFVRTRYLDTYQPH